MKNKPKPFDLEAFKAGEPAMTRSGKVATFLAHYPWEETAACRLSYRVGNECMFVGEDGFYHSDHTPAFYDLVAMQPPATSGWVNVYTDPDRIRGHNVAVVNCDVYETKDAADEAAGPDRIACVQISWEAPQ